MRNYATGNSAHDFDRRWICALMRIIVHAFTVPTVYHIISEGLKSILEEVQASAFLSHVQDVGRSANVYRSLYDDHHGYTDHRQTLYDV